MSCPHCNAPEIQEELKTKLRYLQMGSEAREFLLQADLNVAIEALEFISDFNMGVSNHEDDIIDIKNKAKETLKALNNDLENEQPK